ncbi:MAG TPA: cobalamin-dependent protein [Anaeromyxobacter sp.]|nr:cobalamin-dependent protein [Anaeromyxobacter sp.]
MGRPKGTLHPMSVVVRRTGLTPDVLRAWERRHGAIEPARTPGNQRIFTEEQVVRLELLQRAVAAGWPIGRVAGHTDAELRALIDRFPGMVSPAGEDSAVTVRSDPSRRINGREGQARQGPAQLEHLKARAFGRLDEHDGDGLRQAIEEAGVELGRVALIDEFIAAFVREVGDRVSSGRLRIAQEHLASATTLRYLEKLEPAYPPGPGAPRLVATTPASVHHEIGAALVAATARLEGWRTTYLGPNLPAEEIAAAVRGRGVDVLALSLVPPVDGPLVDEELLRLGKLVGDRVRMVVGGGAAPLHRASLKASGAELIPSLAGLREFLRRASSARGAQR